MPISRWPISRSLTVAAALLLAFGVYAAGEEKAPGFNDMDRDGDGALSLTEAGANPELARRYAEVDADGDGEISRFEYLRAMARDDFTALRERVADFIEPEPESATSGDTKQRR